MGIAGGVEADAEVVEFGVAVGADLGEGELGLLGEGADIAGADLAAVVSDPLGLEDLAVEDGEVLGVDENGEAPGELEGFTGHRFGARSRARG